MKQEHGKNTSKELSHTVLFAKEIFEKNNNILNKPLSSCIKIVKNSNNIAEVLGNELIFLQNLDINIHNNNEQRIDNRVNLCNTALEEYELFDTDKKSYLQKTYKRNIFSAKDIDINKDSLFEQSVKNLIRSLGSEKNASTVSIQMFELYEARQSKLKDICKEFAHERKSFLAKYIKHEKTHEKNNSLER